MESRKPLALAINGSHRKGKNTALMLQIVLEELAKGGFTTELIELMDYRIEYCMSCNHCLRKPECMIKDDMEVIAEKMLSADAIIIGSPVYFRNVTGKMKVFMDRTRWLHMRRKLLEGKLGAAVTHAALRNGGQEITQLMLERFLWVHGLRVVEAREPDGPIYNTAAMGTMYDGLEGKRFRWKKSVLEDELTVEMCRGLGRNILRMASLLRK